MASIASINPAKQFRASQLPIAWYADPAIYAIEQRLLFPKAAQYVGHELMVPHVGDFHTLSWMNDAQALVHNSQGIALISNVCRHRQAIMLNGRGHAQNIVCPLHRWTYNLQGELLGAPHFADNPCLNLGKSPLQNWNGLLFAGKRDIDKDLSSLDGLHDIDFTGYMLDRVKVDEYDFNWKTFIEVYLEDYHVGPFHPGLNQFVDCDKLEWKFGDCFSAQQVGMRHALNKPGSAVYQKWQQLLLQYDNGKLSEHGAMWAAYYPFLMIEWYPHVLVVSHLIPRGVDACTNVVEFYYPEDIALFERDLVEAHQAAYEETAVEDKEICQRMHNGRRALHAQGLDERGPYQHPLETGLEHFHLWLRAQLEPHL